MHPTWAQQASQSFYRQHGPMSDPSRHAATVRSLPDDLTSLIYVVQGLLLHSDQLSLYQLSCDAFGAVSRQTLPVAERLDEVLARDPRPLIEPRPVRERALVTCRDYALLLCGCLRENGWAARVRCGFATYFTAGHYADHWVCEYWSDDAQAWRLADAQLDEAHRTHLGIAFDPTDLPEQAFLNAAEAWGAWRSGKVSADQFGHGEAAGPHFLLINLVRDYLALQKQETSDWDSWRDALPWEDDLAPGLLQQGDQIAGRAATREDTGPSFGDGSADPHKPLPFWRACQ